MVKLLRSDVSALKQQPLAEPVSLDLQTLEVLPAFVRCNGGLRPAKLTW